MRFALSLPMLAVCLIALQCTADVTGELQAPAPPQPADSTTAAPSVDVNQNNGENSGLDVSKPLAVDPGPDAAHSAAASDHSTAGGDRDVSGPPPVPGSPPDAPSAPAAPIVREEGGGGAAGSSGPPPPPPPPRSGGGGTGGAIGSPSSGTASRGVGSGGSDKPPSSSSLPSPHSSGSGSGTGRGSGTGPGNTGTPNSGTNVNTGSGTTGNTVSGTTGSKPGTVALPNKGDRGTPKAEPVLTTSTVSKVHSTTTTKMVDDDEPKENAIETSKAPITALIKPTQSVQQQTPVENKNDSSSRKALLSALPTLLTLTVMAVVPMY